MQGNRAAMRSLELLKPTPPEDSGVGRHVVQFYEDDAFLLPTVANFMVEGLNAGSAALVVATPEHCAGFVEQLRLLGVDVDAEVTSGRLTMLDARTTLDRFVRGGSPDRPRFLLEVGTVIGRAQALSTSGAPYIYGEMVDLLVGAGNQAAAFELERLWNELAETRQFHLLCAYSLARFPTAADVAAFHEICDQHDAAVPTERYLGGDDQARLHEIAILQQQAHALRFELQIRAALEAQLRDSLAEREALIVREREARAEAERANRAKGDFLAIMSHEFRTPLNAITGYVDLLDLEIHGPLSDLQRKNVERIQQSQRRLLDLIDDVLIYARTEAGTIRYAVADVRLADIVHAAEVSVMPLFRERGVEYRSTPIDQDLAIHVDREKAQRVLVNILTNAGTYTEPGGRVTLEYHASRTAVHVRVNDTGIGIPTDKLDAIFQPFVQVDRRLSREYEGAGLGLAVSRELARGMAGEVSVCSTPGVGSTFTLTLPRAAG